MKEYRSNSQANSSRKFQYDSKHIKLSAIKIMLFFCYHTTHKLGTICDDITLATANR